MDESMTNHKGAGGAQSSSESQGNAEKTEAFAVSDTRFASLLIALGFACLLSSALTITASSAFAPQPALPIEGFLSRAFFFIGFVLVQFLSYARFLDRVQESAIQKFAAIVSAIGALAFFGVASASAAGAVLPFPVIGLSWACFGLSSGFMMVAWGIVWTQLDAERPDNHASALNVAASALTAAVLSVFMLFAPSFAVIAAACLFAFASLGLQVYCSRLFPLPESVDIKTSRQRLELFSRNMLAPLLVGIAFGVALAFALSLVDGGSAFAFCLASVAFGAVGSLLLLMAVREVPRFSSLERFICPVFGGCFLLLPYVDGMARLIVLGIIIADTVCYFIFHWNVLIGLSYRHHVRVSFHYGQGLIAPLGGMALGWILVSALAFGAGLPFPTVVLAVSLLLAFALMLVLSIAPYATNKEVEAITGEIAQELQGGTGPWRRRCEGVCEKYSLTPREQEVFILLAKGRNTEVIAKQLFISSHTVKTHTARIYRKLSINSQQELIDLVEEGK